MERKPTLTPLQVTEAFRLLPTNTKIQDGWGWTYYYPDPNAEGFAPECSHKDDPEEFWQISGAVDQPIDEKCEWLPI